MKTLRFITLLGFAGFSFFPVNGQLPKAVDSKIETVHVYRLGADITRSGIISLTEGVHAIYLPDIAENTDETLIQLSLPFGAIITRMEYRELGPDEKPKVDFGDNLQKLKAQQTKVDAINREITAIQGDFDFLRLNQQINTAGTTTAAQIQQADAYFSKRRRELANQLDKLNLDLEKEQQQLQAISLLVNEKRYSHIDNKKVVYAEIKCSKTINGKIQLKYFTSMAGWDPEYVVKSSGIGKEINFTMEAVVDQTTGEEWKNAEIILSTGNPSLATSLPSIPIWYIGENQYYIPMEASAPIAGSRSRTKTIDGYVFDNSTSEEIPRVYVGLYLGNQLIQTTSTDLDGYYSFKGVPAGYFTLKLESVGYDMTSVSGNTFASMSLIRQNVGMTSTSYELSEVTMAASEDDYGYKNRGGRISPNMTPEYDRKMAQASSNQSFIDGVKSKGNDKMLNEVIQLARPVVQIPQEFKLAQKLTIPGNGDPQRTIIKEEKATGNYYHRCRPALNANVFIQAEIPNQSALALLEGPGRVYYNDAYVGNIEIKANSVNDTMIVDFGRDQNVIVKRERIKLNKSQGFLSSKITEEFNYKIQVRNANAQAITLIVQDQLPVSNSTDVKVTAKELSGGRVNPESSVVKWTSTLESGSDKVILFNFEVVYPKDVYINLPR